MKDLNFLIEIFGENNVGKSTQAHSGFPNAITLDTAFTKMGFRELEVESDDEGTGETWHTILKIYDWDEEKAEKHYEYVDDFELFFTYHEAGLFDEFDTIVIDNTRDMRVLAAKYWCEENDTDWPQQAQWGQVNDLIDEVFETYKQTHHVVVVSQMTDEYKDGDVTGNRVCDGPKRMDYKADFRIEISIEDGDRSAFIRKNRWLDPAGDEWVDDMGEEVDFEHLMLLSGIPDRFW